MEVYPAWRAARPNSSRCTVRSPTASSAGDAARLHRRTRPWVLCRRGLTVLVRQSVELWWGQERWHEVGGVKLTCEQGEGQSWRLAPPGQLLGRGAAGTPACERACRLPPAALQERETLHQAPTPQRSASLWRLL